MRDAIDCTDRPKLVGRELFELINTRFREAQSKVSIISKKAWPHRLIITEEQFKTINGGVDTKRNRYVWGPIDHTGTAAYCLEVEVVDA